MEYLDFFNRVYDVLDEDGANVSDEAIEQIRLLVAKAYQKGSKRAVKAYEDDNKKVYEEGRLVGHSLGYKEGFEAGKVIRKQRVLNSFGGR